MEKRDVVLVVFGLIFLFSIIMIFTQRPVSTGMVTEDTTISSVTISTYFAITLSSNLSGGIIFGTLDSTGSNNNNATGNYADSPTDNSSQFFVNVSADSNTGVNFSLKADGPMNTSGGDEIGLGNESYANATTTTFAAPALVNEVNFTTAFVDAGYNVSAGSGIYYRFWLDVPAATPVGTYNNTVSFKGMAV